MRNAVRDNGRREAAHHQFLTEEIGHPALAQHLYGVIGVMRLADDGDRGRDVADDGPGVPEAGDGAQMALALPAGI